MVRTLRKLSKQQEAAGDDLEDGDETVDDSGAPLDEHGKAPTGTRRRKVRSKDCSDCFQTRAKKNSGLWHGPTVVFLVFLSLKQLGNDPAIDFEQHFSHHSDVKRELGRRSVLCIHRGTGAGD